MNASVRGLALLLLGAGCSASADLAADPARLRAVGAIYADSKGASLLRPEGVACAGRYLVVADTGNGRVVLYEVGEGAVQAKREIVLGEISSPAQVQIDPKGDLLVLDATSHRIGRVDSEGRFRGFVTTAPAGLARSFRVDRQGDLYVLDPAGARVVVLAPNGQVLRQIAFAPGYRSIADLAVDDAGAVYLLDCVQARLYVAPKGATTATPLGSSFSQEVEFPAALAATGSGELAVVDRNGGRILMIGSDGSPHAQLAGFGWSEGALRYPGAVCVDERRTIYVADRANNRIGVFRLP